MIEPKIAFHLARIMRAMNWHALGVAAFRVNLALAMAWGIWQVAHTLTIFRGADFSNFYRTDTLRAWTQGWSAYYADGINVSTPLQGVIWLPLLLVSPATGYLLWTLVSLFCVFLIWRLLDGGICLYSYYSFQCSWVLRLVKVQF